MSSSMRNFMEAYLAVYNTEAKEKLNSDRDPISEMNLSSLDDSDLEEIAESILQEMFDEGYSVESVLTIFSEMFVDSNIVGRQKKIERLCESFYKVFKTITSKAPSIAIEEFSKYRNNKKLQESWSARFNQEKRIKRTHNQLVAQESLNVKNLILQLVEKADKSYLEKDMEKRQANNEKAREDMKKKGSMNNPHFGDGPTGSMSSEEVSKIRKGWGDAYVSIYEKKAKQDYDGDGEIESGTDEYMGSKDKAIKKAMGKKGKCENCGGKGCEKCEDSIDEAMRPGPRQRKMAAKMHDPYVRGGSNTRTIAHNVAVRGDVKPGDPSIKSRGGGGVKKDKGMGYGDRGAGNKARRRMGQEPLRGNTRKEDLDIFDIVLEYLQVEGIAESFEDAQWMMVNVLDEEDVDSILDEAITSKKGKAKAAEMIAKRTTASGRAKAGQGANVAQIKHISRANVDGYGGTPPNLKVAKNPVKSNFTGLNTGTGNKAARRAAALKKEEFEFWVD
jgi:hypothetical protein